MSRQLVLLHGLGRSRHSLWPVARAGVARGYRVVSIGYPSRRATLDELAALVAARIAKRVPGGAFDVVTHSMGGIVLRTAVAEGRLAPDRVRRAVMLAPPSQGSELAEQLRDWPLFAHALGPAARQLGTGPESAPLALPPVSFPCGVIAGRRWLNPLTPWIFGGPADGKVSVARARLHGMADFLVVDHSHSFLMWAPDVLAATFAFLERGAFDAEG